jgi:hypothetical protein
MRFKYHDGAPLRSCVVASSRIHEIILQNEHLEAAGSKELTKVV